MSESKRYVRDKDAEREGLRGERVERGDEKKEGIWERWDGVDSDVCG